MKGINVSRIDSENLAPRYQKRFRGQTNTYYIYNIGIIGKVFSREMEWRRQNKVKVDIDPSSAAVESEKAGVELEKVTADPYLIAADPGKVAVDTEPNISNLF